MLREGATLAAILTVFLVGRMLLYCRAKMAGLGWRGSTTAARELFVVGGRWFADWSHCTHTGLLCVLRPRKRCWVAVHPQENRCDLNIWIVRKNRRPFYRQLKRVAVARCCDKVCIYGREGGRWSARTKSNRSAQGLASSNTIEPDRTHRFDREGREREGRCG